MKSTEQGLAHSKCSIKLAASRRVMVAWLTGVAQCQAHSWSLSPTAATLAARNGRGPNPASVGLPACPCPLSYVGPAPPKACPHPCLQLVPQPRFLSHCQSTMAVIINGLSQCDSCGPLKIGLNNKNPAYGNFFSSPAPSFSLPHFSLVMHANIFSPFPPSQTPSSSVASSSGQQGDRLQFCLPVKGR